MNRESHAKASRSRRILLVDDDANFAGLLKDFLLTYRPGEWTVHTAANYNEALACLKEHSFNLVVLDLQMPVMDGMQFLTLLKRSYPGLQVIILSGFVTPEKRTHCLQNGAALVLDKLDFAGGFENICAALENVASVTNEGFRGMLRQVGLPDVLQMECLGRKSTLLEINSHVASGRVFIEDGSIIHAESGPLQGEPALFQLLGLTGGEFHLGPFAKPSRITIDGHWESLLMEAMRLRDEADANIRPGLTAEDAHVPPELPPLEEAASEASQPEKERFTEEVLLCSGTGELLYERQAANVQKRVQLLEFLTSKSNSIGNALEMGHVDRLIMETPDTRVVTVLNLERKVFVRIGIRRN